MIFVVAVLEVVEGGLEDWPGLDWRGEKVPCERYQLALTAVSQERLRASRDVSSSKPTLTMTTRNNQVIPPSTLARQPSKTRDYFPEKYLRISQHPGSVHLES